MAIRSKATIKIPYGINPECWITAEPWSPGLWGIESDCDDLHFQEVCQGERDILLGMLAGLRVDFLIPP